jgi:hypothetical protein
MHQGIQLLQARPQPGHHYNLALRISWPRTGPHMNVPALTDL